MSSLRIKRPADGHIVVTPESAGWTYVGFEVGRMVPGDAIEEYTGDREVCLVFLSGKGRVIAGGKDFGELGGRTSPFDGPPVAVYIPAHTSWVVSATTPVQDAGTLRGLGVTSAHRLPQLTAAPPIADFFPGFERAGWMGFYAPKDTPKAIVDKLSAAFVAGVRDAAPEFVAQGIEPVGTSPTEFAEFIKRDVEQNGTVLRAIK